MTQQCGLEHACVNPIAHEQKKEDLVDLQAKWLATLVNMTATDLSSSTLNISLRQLSLNLAKAGDCQCHDWNLLSQVGELYELLEHRPINDQKMG